MVGLCSNPTIVKYEETTDRISSLVDMLNCVPLTGFNYFSYLLNLESDQFSIKI